MKRQPQRLNRSTTPRLTGHRNQCGACLQAFASQTGFDRHRTGRYGVDRRCMSPAELAAQGMGQDSAGFWRLPDARRSLPGSPRSDDQRRVQVTPHLRARSASWKASARPAEATA